MSYSTGRGGAGNIQSSTNTTSENNHIHLTASNTAQHNPGQPQQNQHNDTTINNNDDKKVYYSTGRGGAGNIQSSSSIPSPKLVPQGSNTPQLHTNKVSTGRGGYGNMLKNDNPELTRKVQDVDRPASASRENDLYAVASNKSFAIGRGGFGNVMAQLKSNRSEALHDKPTLITISSHGETLKGDPKKKGFFNKLKGIFNSD